MKQPNVLQIFFFIILLFSRDAGACSCDIGTWAERVSRARLIIEGSPIKVVHPSAVSEWLYMHFGIGPTPITTYTVKVQKKWRGELTSDEIEVTSGPFSAGMCGTSIEIGQSYMMLFDDGESGYSISLCNEPLLNVHGDPVLLDDDKIRER